MNLSENLHVLQMGLLGAIFGYPCVMILFYSLNANTAKKIPLPIRLLFILKVSWIPETQENRISRGVYLLMAIVMLGLIFNTPDPDTPAASSLLVRAANLGSILVFWVAIIEVTLWWLKRLSLDLNTDNK